MTRRLYVLALLLVATSARADIVLDFSHDTATDNFFGTNATAKAALEAAAADINTAITTSLTGISTDVYTGTNGGTTATFDWRWTYTNPSTGGSETLSSATISGSDVRIYVGMRELSGSTLGRGGPGGVGFSFGGSGFESEWVGAVTDAATQSQTAYTRGGGPTVTNFSGSTTLGTTTANYSIDHGSTIGNLWFDNDSDNNGVADSAALLDTYWSYDHTDVVESGQNDFYSVALHELLHAIGYGTADSWDDLVSGTEWLGAEGIAENGGSGVGLIDGGGAHLASGTSSTDIYSGMEQDAVMTPSIAVGTRKRLTFMDLAILNDIGWDAMAIPEPSFGLAGVLMLGLGAFHRRRKADPKLTA